MPVVHLRGSDKKSPNDETADLMIKDKKIILIVPSTYPTVP
jgi:hypothetical protein